MKIFFKTHIGAIILTLGIFSCTTDKKPEHGQGKEYVMDFVHNNLGLPPRVSKFNDAGFLRSLGYNGMAPHWYVQCGITYDLLEKGIVTEGSEERKWIENNAAILTEKIKKAKEAGIALYPFTDFLVVPASVWEKYGNQMVAAEFQEKAAMGEYRTPDIFQEMTKRILRIQIAEIFETFPELDGLMLRFGETYLHDTPFHLGGSPVKTSGREGIEGHIEMIKLLREEICVKRDKKLFYRTWDFGNFFHVNPEVYLSITDQVEPHENLVFSIKHTRGDYFRTFIFNPTISIGKHRQIVEVQCQREYEGKGAHPDYIAKGVIDGFEEYEYLMKPEEAQCLNDIKDSSQFAGVWTWSRGGGWLGPYLKNEFWCEQNAYVMTKWAQNTSRSEEEIFTEFAKLKGFSDEDIPKLRAISLLSAQAVLRGKYTRYGSCDVAWTRDQFIHGSGALSAYFDWVMNEGLVEEVLAEKKESVDLWVKMVQLARQIDTNDETQDEYLLTSTEYGRIKYEIYEKGWTAMLLGFVGDETGEYDKERIRAAIIRYDELWEEWKELEKNSPSCATIYEPNGFAIRGHLDIYGNPETGIGATIDKYRGI